METSKFDSQGFWIGIVIAHAIVGLLIMSDIMAMMIMVTTTNAAVTLTAFMPVGAPSAAHRPHGADVLSILEEPAISRSSP